MKLKNFGELPADLSVVSPEKNGDEPKVVSKEAAPPKPGQAVSAERKTDRRTFRTAVQEEAHRKALAVQEEAHRKALKEKFGGLSSEDLVKEAVYSAWEDSAILSEASEKLHQSNEDIMAAKKKAEKARKPKQEELEDEGEGSETREAAAA